MQVKTLKYSIAQLRQTFIIKLETTLFLYSNNFDFEHRFFLHSAITSALIVFSLRFFSYREFSNETDFFS